MCMPVFVSLTHGAENQNIFCEGYTSSILITLNSIDYIFKYHVFITRLHYH